MASLAYAGVEPDWLAVPLWVGPNSTNNLRPFRYTHSAHSDARNVSRTAMATRRSALVNVNRILRTLIEGPLHERILAMCRTDLIGSLGLLRPAPGSSFTHPSHPNFESLPKGYSWNRRGAAAG